MKNKKYQKNIFNMKFLSKEKEKLEKKYKKKITNIQYDLKEKQVLINEYKLKLEEIEELSNLNKGVIVSKIFLYAFISLLPDPKEFINVSGKFYRPNLDGMDFALIKASEKMKIQLGGFNFDENKYLIFSHGIEKKIRKIVNNIYKIIDKDVYYIVHFSIESKGFYREINLPIRYEKLKGQGIINSEIDVYKWDFAHFNIGVISDEDYSTIYHAQKGVMEAFKELGLI